MIEWVVPVFVAWVASEVRLAYEAEPAIRVDYAAQLRDIAIEAQPAGEDLTAAWDEQVTSIAESFEVVTRRSLEGAGAHDPMFWPDASLVYAEHWTLDDLEAGYDLDSDMTMTEQVAALGTIRESYINWLESWGASGIESSWRTLTTTPGFVAHLPEESLSDLVWAPSLDEYSAARQVARLLRARIWLAAQRQDDPDFLPRVQSALYLVRSLEAQPLLEGWLTGSAIRSLIAEELRIALIERRLSADQLRGIGKTVSANRPISVARAFEGELRVALDAIQHTHDSRGRPLYTALDEYYGILGDEASSPLNNLWSIILPRRLHAEAMVRSMYERMIEHSRLTPRQSLDAKAHGETMLTGIPTLAMALTFVLPPSSNAVDSANMVMTEWEGLELVIAVERFRAERGELPVGLTDLVPGFLPSVPVDPWSHGSPWSYERNGTMLGYALYSVGYDGQDNRGRMPQDGNERSALSARGPGTDYLITRPAS